MSLGFKKTERRTFRQSHLVKDGGEEQPVPTTLRRAASVNTRLLEPGGGSRRPQRAPVGGDPVGFGTDMQVGGLQRELNVCMSPSCLQSEVWLSR